MKKDKWIVIVLEKEEVGFVLDGVAFDSEEEAWDAIRKAQAEDVVEQWYNFSYSDPLVFFV